MTGFPHSSAQVFAHWLEFAPPRAADRKEE